MERPLSAPPVGKQTRVLDEALVGASFANVSGASVVGPHRLRGNALCMNSVLAVHLALASSASSLRGDHPGVDDTNRSL
jgi:hypothetical protein